MRHFSCFVLVVLFAGCGGSSEADYRDQLVPASGKITVDGKPSAGIAVTFLPKDQKGRIGRGVTDDEGVYEISSFPPSKGSDRADYAGAIPGEYDVVLKREPEGLPESPAIAPGQGGDVPGIYQKPGRLKASVGASGGNFDFQVNTR